MSNNKPETQSNEEVDLGQLFKLIGNGLKNLFNFIGKILNKLFLAFVWMVFFVKKHIVKIAIAGIIGFGLGFVKQKIEKPIYKSQIIIKQNYLTGKNLNNSIEYYNELIAKNDSIALSKSLNITIEEAALIKGFEIESILNQNNKLKLFDAYTKELDSTLATTVVFHDYVENSNDYDYQFQKITLKSFSNQNNESIFSQLIKNIESSAYFKNQQEKDLAELNRREIIIKQSLKQSDSLQKVYKEVLEKSVEKVAGGETSITFEGSDDKSVTKEFELYNNDLLLRRELVNIESQKDDKEHIIEIVSNNLIVGTLDNSTSILGFSINNKIKYVIFLSLLTFMILLFIEFMKYLERYKNKI